MRYIWAGSLTEITENHITKLLELCLLRYTIYHYLKHLFMT